MADHSGNRIAFCACGLRALKFLSALAIIATATPAIAQNANTSSQAKNALKQLQKIFKANGGSNSNKNQFCAIVITQSGQLRASPDDMTLGSNLMGGQPGSADVVATNGSYSISIDQGIGFTSQPAGGSANTTFSSTFSATGATNFAETPGQIPQKVKPGTTEIEANFIATRAQDPFPAGNYSGELVLRCE